MPTLAARVTSPRPYVDVVTLDGTETYRNLRARGLSKSCALLSRKRGYYTRGWHAPAYPQEEGAGGYAVIADMPRFVRAYVKRALSQQHVRWTRDLLDDLTQDCLLACWQRRHAAHIPNFPKYYSIMIRGLVWAAVGRWQRDPLARARPYDVTTD